MQQTSIFCFWTLFNAFANETKKGGAQHGFQLSAVSGQENNFEITSSAFVTTQGIPYDLGSVMHYSAFAFSRNRQPTIEPVNPSVQLSSLGQRNGFSPSDIQHVNTLYCGGGKHRYSPKYKQKFNIIRTKRLKCATRSSGLPTLGDQVACNSTISQSRHWAQWMMQQRWTHAQAILLCVHLIQPLPQAFPTSSFIEKKLEVGNNWSEAIVCEMYASRKW